VKRIGIIHEQVGKIVPAHGEKRGRSAKAYACAHCEIFFIKLYKLFDSPQNFLIIGIWHL
jgi:hypothetical protein